MRLTDGTAEPFALAAPLGDEGRVHPFDGPVVVAVRGAVGRELARDADDLTGVLVGVIAPHTTSQSHPPGPTRSSTRRTAGRRHLAAGSGSWAERFGLR